MRAATFLLLMLAAGLAGCVPFPHYELTQPEVDGVLATAGTPRAGVMITACQGLPEYGRAFSPRRCDQVASTTTDAQGRFHFERHGRVSLFLIMDSATYEILGVQAGGGERVWYRGYWRPAPPHVDLNCELNEQLVCQSSQTP
ncbi:hypothetical protein [Scleromatobacter humisilvae]|uniref:Carboxypeptidase regulatory-like domain-containing protein n=1 Tax=Scleromatobacter humisilvae TaxID=2897159 RepID=A0A9X1YKP5_9BURK|nr:hypothetical protein [Scleromatobacter humisilvae]MCK9688079.1 hypothetical protein [Scleromatobacter humisilvae]